MANVELTETELEKKYHGILEILLIDRTSNKNIIWATSNYSRFGKGFMSTDHMPLKYLINHSRQIVKPRILKSKTEQKKRSKDMAEVFTPAWICNLQNNMIDKRMNGSELRKAVELAPNTLTKLYKEEPVSVETLLRICEYLNCDIGDIVEFSCIGDKAATYKGKGV